MKYTNSLQILKDLVVRVESNPTYDWRKSKLEILRAIQGILCRDRQPPAGTNKNKSWYLEVLEGPLTSYLAHDLDLPDAAPIIEGDVNRPESEGSSDEEA